MTQHPLPWSGTTKHDSWFAAVAQGGSILMLDYDGTLAPFAKDRLRARPYPGVEALLEQLAALRTMRLVLVTGRPVRELQSLLSLAIPFEIWGSHGREQITATGQYQLRSVGPEQKQALETIASSLDAQGYGPMLEYKPASLALHWRSLAPEKQSDAESTLRGMYGDYGAPTGLQLLPFDGGLEIRSEDVNKGDAVRSVLESMHGDGTAVAYLGDDTTDEDAFRALHGRGLSMLVRVERRESEADYWMRPPEELLRFLEDWYMAARNKEL